MTILQASILVSMHLVIAGTKSREVKGCACHSIDDRKRDLGHCVGLGCSVLAAARFGLSSDRTDQY